MYKTSCVGEDVVVDVRVFQGRMGIVINSVDEEHKTQQDRKEDDTRRRMEESRGRLDRRHFSEYTRGQRDLMDLVGVKWFDDQQRLKFAWSDLQRHPKKPQHQTQRRGQEFDITTL